MQTTAHVSNTATSRLTGLCVCLIMVSAGGATVDKEKILVVDDEEAIREVISTLLEAQGYRCTVCSNGRLALDAFRKDSFDLVLSDIVMPEMDGLKLLAELRQDDPDVPVIMVTAMHDISIALEAIRAGAYDYILKPFEKDQLHLSVRRALEHRQLVHRESHLSERPGTPGRRAHAAAFHCAAGPGAILRLHARSAGRRARRQGCGNRRPLPARDGIHDHDCEGHGRGKGLLRHIARGAFLHDIGKMGVPDQILRKPGPLTAEEREIMRRHCEIGFAVLERIPFLKEAAEIVLSHQECYDGSGYPRGLKGEADSPGSPDFRGGGYAGRHDFRPALPQGAADFRRARRDPEIFGHAVRSARREGISRPTGKALAGTSRESRRSLPPGPARTRVVPENCRPGPRTPRLRAWASKVWLSR